MNKVYKTIWSWARHAFVVSDEFHRAHVKSAHSDGASAAAALGAVALLLTPACAISATLDIGNGQSETISNDQSYEYVYVSGTGSLSLASGATLTLTGASDKESGLEVYYDGSIQAQGKIIASVSRDAQVRSLMLIGGNVSMSEVSVQATSQNGNAIGIDAQNGNVSVSKSITVTTTAGATSTGYAHGVAFASSLGNRTISLNRATVTATSKGVAEATGLFVQAQSSDQMIFTGTTVLNAHAQGSGEAMSIWGLGGNLTFSGPVTLTASSAASGAYGLKAQPTNNQRPVVHFEDVTTINATGDAASHGISAGQASIQADKKISVNAKALDDNQNAYAVSLSGSTFTASGGVDIQSEADGFANGLYLDSGTTVTVQGGLAAKVKSNAGDAYGIHAAEANINYSLRGASIALDVSAANTAVSIDNGAHGVLEASEKIEAKASSNAVANVIRSFGFTTSPQNPSVKQGMSLVLDAPSISLEASVAAPSGSPSGRASVIDSVSAGVPEQTTVTIGGSSARSISLTAKATGDVFAYGIDSASGTVKVGNSNSAITINATADTRQAVGISVRDQGVVIVNGKTEISAQSNGTNNNSIGIFVSGGRLDLNSDVTAYAAGGENPSAKALRVQDSGVVNFSGGSALMRAPVRVVGDGKLNVKSGRWAMDSFRIEDNGAVTVAQGASLATLTSQIFTVALDETGTNVGEGMAAKYSASNLSVAGGATLAFNDAKYNSVYATRAGNLYPNATLVFNGERVEAAGGSLDIADLADDENIVESNVQASISDTSGGQTVSIDKSFGVSSMNVNSSTADSLKINKSITLVGSADGSELITFSSDGNKSVKVSEGSTLNLGHEGASGNTGRISAELIVESGSSLKVNTGSFDLASVQLAGSTLEVANGSLELDKLGLSGTNNTINLFGDVSIQEIVADILASTEALFRIGQSDSDVAGQNKKGLLNLANAVISGLTFFLDPAYKDGDTISDASGMAIQEAGTIASNIIVGQNSWLGVGANADAVKSAQETFSNSLGGASWGKVTAFAHFAGDTTITGKVLVDSSLTTVAAATAAIGGVSNGSLTVNNGVLSIASGVTVTGEGTLTMADGTYLYVPGIQDGDSISTVADFGEYAISDITVVVNALQYGSYNDADKTFSVTTDPTRVPSLKVPNTVVEALNPDTAGEGAETIRSIVKDAGMDVDKLADGVNKIAEFAYAGAAQSVAVTTATMVDESIAEHALGRGVAENQSSVLWVVANGSFSKANHYGFGSAGYRSDIGGITLGADSEVGKGFTAGMAFSAGTGKVRGRKSASGVKNDVDYYGLSLYGALATDYVDLVGSVSWMLSKNEISGNGMKAKPDTNTVTVGLYAQRSFDLTPAISVTPHIGVRYIRADLDDFKAGGFSYKTDAANIVQFPVGVAFGAKTETMSGCKVNGFVDLSVVPAVGDKKSDMRFSLAGGSASDSVEGKIASTALYRANFGVNVKGGAHTLGASYGIGGGNGGRLDQTLKVNYRYAF